MFGLTTHCGLARAGVSRLLLIYPLPGLDLLCPLLGLDLLCPLLGLDLLCPLLGLDLVDLRESD
jgi:hypothetical protein